MKFWVKKSRVNCPPTFFIASESICHRKPIHGERVFSSLLYFSSNPERRSAAKLTQPTIHKYTKNFNPEGQPDPTSSDFGPWWPNLTQKLVSFWFINYNFKLKPNNWSNWIQNDATQSNFEPWTNPIQLNPILGQSGKITPKIGSSLAAVPGGIIKRSRTMKTPATLQSQCIY